jgi:hypothetical protein
MNWSWYIVYRNKNVILLDRELNKRLKNLVNRSDKKLIYQRGIFFLDFVRLQNVSNLIEYFHLSTFQIYNSISWLGMLIFCYHTFLLRSSNEFLGDPKNSLPISIKRFMDIGWNHILSVVRSTFPFWFLSNGTLLSQS